MTRNAEGAEANLGTDAEAGQRQSDRQELLIAELNHRLRNVLGLLQGIVSQSRRSATTVDELAAVVGERIAALGRAHDQLMGITPGPATFEDVLVAETSAYLQTKATRVRSTGPSATLKPRAFTPVALVVHELVTNAMKHGALRNETGDVQVTTGFDAVGNFTFEWREQGGPRVAPPARRGFGSTVIERSIPHDLGGNAALAFEPGGLRAQFVIPASFVAPAKAGTKPEEKPLEKPESEAQPLPSSVLLVEDHMLIALDTEGMLRELGIADVRTATDAAGALRALDQSTPDFVLLDVNLGGATSFAVAERLTALGVAFAFATGYSEQVMFPPAFRDVPKLRKPYSNEAIRHVLGLAMRKGKEPGDQPSL